MTINEIRQQAKKLGVKLTKGMKKADMILAIQQEEGNFPCFGTSNGHCDQEGCSWQKDCLQSKQGPAS